jgi:predicted dithiol-disulfide oxidoreductase (DUF899 family)
MSAKPEVVDAAEWARQRDELLIREKQATRLLDELAAQRRRLPMVEFDVNRYEFATPDGPKSLLDLFDERDELVVYQFMDRGPDAFCPGCTNFTNNVVNLAALGRAGVSWITVSNMPLEQLEGYRTLKGWSVPIASSHGTSFSDDCGAGGGFLLSIFLRDGEKVFRTYSTTSRGVDRMMFVTNIQDLLPFGRREDWEDSPEGWPQEPTYG